MKKVLILANHAITIYNFRMELVRKLIEGGNEVYLSAPYSELIEDIKKEKCIYRDIQLERHGTNPIKDFGLIREYQRLIKEIKPDIIFSYTIKPNIYGAIAAAKYKLPFVANITGLGSAIKNNRLFSRFIMAMYKYAFRKIQTVFFQNEENMALFEKKKIALGKHKLLPGSGVNLERFYYQKYPDTEQIKFVFVSRIMREKGVEEFFEAAQYIKSKYPEVEFHVCGFCEEAYEQRLEALHEEQIINYHGMVKDIREILKDMHCIVLPSYHEGMSNVLLEAAAVGRPAIATDIPGCRECVENEQSGYLINVHSAEDLIAKMEQFILLSHEQKKTMGLHARKYVEQRFDRQQVVDAYIKEI